MGIVLFRKKLSALSGNYLLLTGCRICHYLMERTLALQQMNDKKNTLFFI